jgi:hypothetical protein
MIFFLHFERPSWSKEICDAMCSYIGEFSCGRRHGWGELLRADGSRRCCHWVKDLPVVEDDPGFSPSEQQRLVQLERSLCDWVSGILAAASVSPLSSDDMRARAEAHDLHPPPAPPAISDAALTSSTSAREAEVLIIQRMSAELASLRKLAGDSQSLSHSIEVQRSELSSANMQLQHSQAMQNTLQASLASTDQRLQSALASLTEAQEREQKLLQEVSAASAECSACRSQLVHQQNMLDAAQDTASHLKGQVCPRCSSLSSHPSHVVIQMAEQQRAHEEELAEHKRAREEELARYQHIISSASQETANRESLLQGNISQLQTQLLEAQAHARNQCNALASRTRA